MYDLIKLIFIKHLIITKYGLYFNIPMRPSPIEPSEYGNTCTSCHFVSFEVSISFCILRGCDVIFFNATFRKKNKDELYLETL